MHVFLQTANDLVTIVIPHLLLSYNYKKATIGRRNVYGILPGSDVCAS